MSYVNGLRRISQDRAGERSFYHIDGLGSTRAMTDDAGAVVQRYTYDAFGNLLVAAGSIDNTNQFAGEHRDATLGLDYLRARFMDPATGRFISSDPFPGALNSPGTLHDYAYAGNNPVMNVDPTGLFIGAVSFVASFASSVGTRFSEASSKLAALCRVKSLAEATSKISWAQALAMNLGTSLAAARLAFSSLAVGSVASAAGHAAAGYTSRITWGFALVIPLPARREYSANELIPRSHVEKVEIRGLVNGKGQKVLSVNLDGLDESRTVRGRKVTGKQKGSFSINLETGDISISTGFNFTLLTIKSCGLIDTFKLDLALRFSGRPVGDFRNFSAALAGSKANATGTGISIGLDITILGTIKINVPLFSFFLSNTSFPLDWSTIASANKT